MFALKITESKGGRAVREVWPLKGEMKETLLPEKMWMALGDV